VRIDKSRTSGILYYTCSRQLDARGLRRVALTMVKLADESGLYELVKALVPGAADQWLDFFAELLRIRRRVVHVKSLLVFPDANKRQMIRAAGLLEYFEADAVFLFRGFSDELLQKRDSRWCAVGHEINVGHNVNRFLRPGKAGTQKYNQHKKKPHVGIVTESDLPGNTWYLEYKEK